MMQEQTFSAETQDSEIIEITSGTPLRELLKHVRVDEEKIATSAVHVIQAYERIDSLLKAASENGTSPDDIINMLDGADQAA